VDAGTFILTRPAEPVGYQLLQENDSSGKCFLCVLVGLQWVFLSAKPIFPPMTAEEEVRYG